MGAKRVNQQTLLENECASVQQKISWLAQTRLEGEQGRVPLLELASMDPDLNFILTRGGFACDDLNRFLVEFFTHRLAYLKGLIEASPKKQRSGENAVESSFVWLPKDIWNHIVSYLTPEEKAPLSCMRPFYQLLQIADSDLKTQQEIISYAAEKGWISLVQWLVKKGFPTTTICERAAKGGHLELLQWARSQGFKWMQTGAQAAKHAKWDILLWALSEGCPLNTHTFSAVARTGNLKMLQLLENMGCDMDSDSFIQAGLGGHVDILVWLRIRIRGPWHSGTTLGPAAGGHLEALDWMVENGCAPNDSYLLGTAAMFGQTKIIQWILESKEELKARQYEIEWDFDPEALDETRMVEFAAARGHLETLVWVKDKGYFPEDAENKICIAAAAGGHIAVLEWYQNQGYPFSSEAYRAAAYGGHLATLKWLESHQCPLPTGKDAQGVPDLVDITFEWEINDHVYYEYLGESLGLKIQKDHFFEICLWWKQNGLPLQPWMCKRAAETGDLDLLQWLRSNHCAWNAETFNAAAAKGSFTILEWLYANGCPWNETTCAVAAEKSFKILKWLRVNGCPWDVRTFTAAAGASTVSRLKWLHAQGCPWDKDVFSQAVINGTLENVKWLRENGCPWEKKQIRDWKNELYIRDPDTLPWLNFLI